MENSGTNLQVLRRERQGLFLIFSKFLLKRERQGLFLILSKLQQVFYSNKTHQFCRPSCRRSVHKILTCFLRCLFIQLLDFTINVMPHRHTPDQCLILLLHIKLSIKMKVFNNFCIDRLVSLLLRHWSSGPKKPSLLNRPIRIKINFSRSQWELFARENERYQAALGWFTVVLPREWREFFWISYSAHRTIQPKRLNSG